MTTESKQITAKFTGKCVRCGGVIPSGTRCNWVKGEGVRHINNCVATSVSAPVVQRQDKQVAVTMGVFKKDGRIYVVKPNKERIRVYAKEIVESPARMTENGEVADFETVYAPGVVFKLTEADRWDLADAKDFLTKFARCIVCGRHLKAAKSVAGSIGPICAKYFAHSHACDDKPVVKLAAVKAQAEIDAEDKLAKAKIAADIAAADAEEEIMQAQERLNWQTQDELIDRLAELSNFRNGSSHVNGCAHHDSAALAPTGAAAAAADDENDHSMRRAIELIASCN